MNSLHLPNLHLPNLPDLIPDLSDLSRASGCWLATLGVGIAVGFPISGAADPIESQPASEVYRRINPKTDRPPAWLGENVHYKRGVGLEYRHEAKLGSNPIELGVHGPLVKGRKESSPFPEPMGTRRVSGLGLAFEVRF